MEKHRPTMRRAIEVTRGDPSDVHQYKMPTAAKISIEVEKSLGLKIQSPTRKIESLAAAAWPEISSLLDTTDLRPLLTEKVKDAARASLASVARSITASQMSSTTFAAHVQRGFRDNLAASLTSHGRTDGLI